MNIEVNGMGIFCFLGGIDKKAFQGLIIWQE
jgi:hypothetical protein